MIDLPLNESVPPVPPVPPTFTEDTHTALDEIGNVLQGAELAVIGDSLDKLQQIESACTGLEAKLRGRVELGLDRVEAACAKVRQRIQTQLSGKMGAAYEYMAGAGIPVPGRDEVLFGAATAEAKGEILPTKPGSDCYFDKQQGLICTPTVSPLPGGSPLQPPLLPPGQPQQPPQSPIGTPPQSLPGLPPGQQPLPPQLPPQPPATGPGQDGAGGVSGIGDGLRPPEQPAGQPIRPGQCVDAICPPQYGPGGQLVCPPGYKLVTDASGISYCVKPVPTQPAPQPAPQPGPTPEPPPSISPPSPPPTMGPGPNPQTCDYPPSPTSLVGSGSCPPPPRPPSPYWVEYWCEDCGWKWHIYNGDTRPVVPADHMLEGPFATPPDPSKVCNKACKVTVGGQPTGGPTGGPAGPGPIPVPPPQPPPPQPAPEDKPKPPPAVPPDGEPHGPNIVCDEIAEQAQHWANVSEVLFAAIELFSPSDDLTRTITDSIKQLSDLLLGQVNCKGPQLSSLSLAQGLIRLIDRWTDMVPDQVMEKLRQQSNTLCQYNLPLGGSADMAFLRGDITEEEWVCYHKAQGDHIGPAGQMMRAGRSKLDPQQLDKLFRRKKIDQASYDKLMREAGVLFDGDKRRIHDYNEQFPTQSDVVTLMQRDVADEVNVDWTESDKIFLSKYTGKVKEWFEANGLSEETAKMYWRAHWHIPSYTQGADFVHRLRPGEVPKQLEFTREQYRQMLLQDDHHPAFVDYMIEMTYRPVNLRDARQAYMAHASSDETLKKQLMDLGRKPDVADFYVKFYKRLRTIKDLKDSGVPTIRQLIGSYAKCELTRGELGKAVMDLYEDREQMLTAIGYADANREIYQRKQAIRDIRGEYVVGIIDEAEAIERMTDAKLDPECIDQLLAQWISERQRKSKRVSAEKLCKWRWYGIIDFKQQVDALARIGWQPEDALRIAEQCTAELSDKARKIAASSAEKQARELRRRQREAERAARLAQCGPPKCPANTPGGQAASGAGQKTPVPSTNGTGTNIPPNQSSP